MWITGIPYGLMLFSWFCFRTETLAFPYRNCYIHIGVGSVLLFLRGGQCESPSCGMSNRYSSRAFFVYKTPLANLHWGTWRTFLVMPMCPMNIHKENVSANLLPAFGSNNGILSCERPDLRTPQIRPKAWSTFPFLGSSGTTLPHWRSDFPCIHNNINHQ